jgi:hypothetical protein
MEKAKSKIQKARKAVTNRFADFAYKPKTVAPFGLQSDTSSLLGEILKEDSTLKDSVTGLMGHAKSTGTMENYERVAKKFEKFCSNHGYSYPRYTEQAVLHYVIQLDKDRTSMAMLGQVKPALTLLEELTGTDGSAWTSMVNIFLVSAKRRAAEMKPVVKKAGVLPDDTLFRMYPTCFQCHEDGQKSADPVKLRTYVRAVVVFFTFCRFSVLPNCEPRILKIWETVSR